MCPAGAERRTGGGDGEREAAPKGVRERGKLNHFLQLFLVTNYSLCHVSIMWADRKHAVEACRCEKRGGQY